MNKNIYIKNAISHLLLHSGLFYILSSVNKSAPILMYHRILSPEYKEQTFVQPGMYVSTKSFRSHLLFLKKHYQILPLTELIQRAGKPDIKRCCAITFDDGWLDNYTQAYPLLVLYRIPATIFLTTGFIGTYRLFWPEELASYMKLPESKSVFRQHHVFKRLFASEELDIKNSKVFIDSAIMALKGWAPQERTELIEQLRKITNISFRERSLMNWQEVKKMEESGLITFGAHTANHVMLDQVPLEEAEAEIVQSRNAIKDHLGFTPKFFAYPNGNYNFELKRLLRKHDFISAVTTKKGWFNKDCDFFEIPRIGIHEDISSTIPLFQARISMRLF